jgi:hypothetical protein
MPSNIAFTGGPNIAIKIPRIKYADTVKFYRDVLRLEVEEQPIDSSTVSRTHRVKFGASVVWLDCVDNYTHSETWLELRTPDVPLAADYLRSRGVATVDELERIPKEMHWVMDPAGTVLLLCKPGEVGK